jgi:hypothetical protein
MGLSQLVFLEKIAQKYMKKLDFAKKRLIFAKNFMFNQPIGGSLIESYLP